MSAPEAIIKLVEKFEFHREAYKRGQYNETQLRREFLDLFFKALGWDVDNNRGWAEAYKEVAHEDPIQIRGQTQYIDYSFRIGGVRKFIVEAKKPAVNIKNDTKSALQLRRYGWNAGLKLSILSDFEEFAVYDCTKKIEKEDTAATARIAYLTFDEYPEKWDWIASIFTGESIQNGSFDKFVESKKGRRGTAGVDDAFLADIEEWRLLLARNIALRNSLSVEELNTAVQRIIDRIIFLRICEDRGIEKYGTLQELLECDSVYSSLCDLFRHADDRYNSGLFYFDAEPGRNEMPDELTPGLTIDDKVLKAIIKRLYYPESPYEFSVIPTDILGHVYEQFLGKVIRLTSGNRAKVEEKPEVRKAGGVFYTPTYIVDYIVHQTVGELLKEKTPKEVSNLTILDPACGSGSFLIGAYQLLLDWHRDWYIANLVPVLKDKGPISPEVRALLPAATATGTVTGAETGTETAAGKRRRKKKKNEAAVLPVYRADSGTVSRVRSDWKLTTAERKRILLNNIYGVDIDRQAVEVTKLSLLLKVLEEESEETVSKQLKLFAERALPSLNENIKCGNSLIGTDIYADVQVTLDQTEAMRINAFDWEREFAGVMKAGGFDAVIGNPPYVRQELLKDQKEYFKNHYAVYHGVADLYAYFIEKGVSLLRPGGFFSYIVANKWMRANYGKPLRQWLKEKQIEEIIDFGDLPVFRNVTTYPCIMRISGGATSGSASGSFDVVQAKTLEFSDLLEYVKEQHYTVNRQELDDSGWSLVDERTQAVLNKLQQTGVPLGEYVGGKIYRGVLTGLNKAFVIDDATRERLIAEDPKSEEVIKPFLAGRDVKRYQPLETDKYLIFTRRGIDIMQYPAIETYLKQFKKELMPKPKDWSGGKWDGRKPGSYQWYEIQDSIDYYREFEKPKIIIPSIVKSASYAYDTDGFYSNDKTSIIPVDDPYLLGILNSKVADFVIFLISSTKQGGYYEYKPMYVSKIPVRTINFSDPADVASHDRMVALVEQMLTLHKRLPEAKTDQENTSIRRQIEATDGAIDALVYELYGLTEEEIEIVEGK